jgi:hypothetical protein
MTPPSLIRKLARRSPSRSVISLSAAPGGHHEAIHEKPSQTLDHPAADTLPGTAQRPTSDGSEVRIALPTLGCGPPLQSLGCLGLIGEDLDLLLTFRVNEAPIADQPDRTEQITLNHQAEEACPALLRVAPIEHQMVPYGRTGIRYRVGPSLTRVCLSGASFPSRALWPARSHQG